MIEPICSRAPRFRREGGGFEQSPERQPSSPRHQYRHPAGCASAVQDRESHSPATARTASGVWELLCRNCVVPSGRFVPPHLLPERQAHQLHARGVERRL